MASGEESGAKDLLLPTRRNTLFSTEMILKRGQLGT